VYKQSPEYYLAGIVSQAGPSMSRNSSISPWSIKTHCHDSPFGGKAELCLWPPSARRTNWHEVSADHWPFHDCKCRRTASSVTSGTQKPVRNSFSSDSRRWSSSSSRRLGGRPLRRSFPSCVISSSPRRINLTASDKDVTSTKLTRINKPIDVLLN
jgi:hypothetical protein